LLDIIQSHMQGPTTGMGGEEWWFISHLQDLKWTNSMVFLVRQYHSCTYENYIL